MSFLPYSFAKRHQILLLPSVDSSMPPSLILTEQTSPSAINEAIRYGMIQGQIQQPGLPGPQNQEC